MHLSREIINAFNYPCQERSKSGSASFTLCICVTKRSERGKNAIKKPQREGEVENREQTLCGLSGNKEIKARTGDFYTMRKV